MKALIDLRNNRICQVEQDSAVFAVAEDLAWVDCPDDVTTAHEFDGTFFKEIVTAENNIGVFKNSNLTEEQKLTLIIEERNKRLAACDWTQLSDVILLHNESWLNTWRTYRQKLRDLPTSVDVNNPLYPIPPL